MSGRASVARAAVPRRAEQQLRDRLAAGATRVAFGTHCVDCYPTNCPLYVFVKAGRVVREEAAGILPQVEPGVPDMNPLVCQKGLAWSRQLDAPDRVLHPLRRAGARGEGRWDRLGWDAALDEVADAIVDAIVDGGPESVVHEVSPEIAATIPALRFMEILGGTALDVGATINDFWSGFHQVFGKFSFAPSIDDTFHADCILVWHSNPAYTQIPAFHYIVEARYRGAEVILIAPDVSPSHAHADVHVPIRHGTDAALALAMCQTVLAEGRADLVFVREQTDLALLVRCDTGEYLRGADLDGGRTDTFFHLHPTDGIVRADPSTLRLDFVPRLEGTETVRLVSGALVTVEPLLARVRRLLDARYTPEAASRVCGVHPETIRTIARTVAAKRTRILPAAGVAKYYHGDLMARAMLLLLALTGNWGKKGAGVSGWCASLLDGHATVLAKTQPGVAGARELIDGLAAMREQLRATDPTLGGGLADTALWRLLGPTHGISPPVFFWYWHAGYRERWNRREWSDPAMARDFDAYWNEALASGGWGSAARPGPDVAPRVLLEIGGNTMRRTRGGQGLLLDGLWSRLTTVVCMDTRMSETARHADIVLPATQHYEKTTLNMPTPWTMFLTMSDVTVTPAGEARSEWTVLAALCRALANRARARCLDAYVDRAGVRRRYDELWTRFTLGGTLVDDESVAAEIIADSVASGNLPPGTSTDTFRERGVSRYADWGFLALARAQASPFPRGETHAPLRDHVERGEPYPTLTRRAQFLIDHPWYREAGEDLPAHKEPPAMGGAAYPFLLSGGHGRWSIHAMNVASPLLLETHRGKPFVLVNDADARAKGIADDAPVRIWNDVGAFVVAARVSPAQRPGALTVYNGFEGFMFPGGKGSNEVEPGMVKWLHLVAGWGHLSYAPTEWQPVPFDRCIRVDCAPVDAQPSTPAAPPRTGEVTS